MYPAIKAALFKSGILGVMNREIRDGSGSIGRYGILSLYRYMGNSRILLLVEQLFGDTPLEDIIRVCIEDMVLEAGRYGPLWLMSFPIISQYIDRHNWMYAATEYNYKHQITI